MAIEQNDPLGRITGSNLGVASGQWAGVEANRMLAGDVEAMKKQELGKTQGEKDEASQMDAAATAMQAQTQQQGLNRDVRANPGGYTGEYAEATRELGEVAGEQEAVARAEQDAIGRRQADDLRVETIGRTERQQEIGQDWRNTQQDNHNQRAQSILGMFSML